MLFGLDINGVLLFLLVVTGAIWGIHSLYQRGKPRAPKTKPAWWLDYSRSFFPVILLVFVIRSFLLEPYQIPSESMLPSLRGGDFILVNKYRYGLRLPVNNFELLAGAAPQTGDVVVFNYPADRRLRYIKRLIGRPGDRIVYRDKQLFINDNAIIYLQDEEDPEILLEALNQKQHRIQYNLLSPGEDGSWTVPQGHYFVMGDNRDNSNDSRFWGFVPHHDLVGKAVYIWMHWKPLLSFPDFRHNGMIR